MKMKIPPLKPYLWVGYPLAVLVLVILTINSRQTFNGLLQKKQQASENQKILGRLTNKLATLKQVNTAQTTQDLSWMLQVMPKQKLYDTLVNQIRFAAQSSGVSLIRYKGGGSEETDVNLNAEFLVADFNSFQKMVATLENSIPLLSITNVLLEGPKLTMNVASAWSPLTPASVKIDEDLPDYISGLAKIKTTLSGYQVPLVVPAAASTSATPSTEFFARPPGSD